MRHPKFSERDDTSDGHRVLDPAILIFFFWLKVRAVGVRFSRARERFRDYFSRGADQAPVQSGNRELVGGFCDHVLGLTVKLGIRCLHKGIGNRIGLDVWAMVNEIPDGNSARQIQPCRQNGRRASVW